MNTEERIQEALRALAAEDRLLAAPYRVEIRARAAFRRRFAGRMLSHAIAWGLALAAAAIMTFAITNGAFRAKQRPAPKTASTPFPIFAANDLAKYQDMSMDDSAQGTETTTDFIPLTVGPAPDDGEFLVRVKLPAQVAQTVGYPIEQDRLDQPVEADVLVGEEGVARAIRFVRDDE